MTDLYAVFGNPIAHSKSPAIHAEFARQTGQDMRYTARLAPLDDFVGALRDFRTEGGCGANVTVPFKEQAHALAARHSPRAQAAGAVNTLIFESGGWTGDNTDGVGLVRDVVTNLDFNLTGRRVLLLGAGGAARGVILPLLGEQPASLVIANRTADKAAQLADYFRALPGLDARTHLTGGGFDTLDGQRFDCVLNATAASLAGDLPPLPDNLFMPGALAYDMMYGRETPFMAFGRERGARIADGLGMLVEQAAEAFHLWRGVRPATAPVMAMLRQA